MYIYIFHLYVGCFNPLPVEVNSEPQVGMWGMGHGIWRVGSNPATCLCLQLQHGIISMTVFCQFAGVPKENHLVFFKRFLPWINKH